MILRLLTVIALSVLSISSSAWAKTTTSSTSTPDRSYTFGVVPQQSSSTLAQDWGPMLAQLSAMTGFRLVFKTAPDVSTFERRLSEGKYDFAYMNPYHYVVFSQRPGYRAIARSKGRHIYGIVVVQKDAPYQSIHELSSKVIAFPSPSAFAASLLVQAEFRREGIKIDPKYVSSHDSVYRDVAKGLMPAGGGVLRTFQALPRAVRDDLRILWSAPGHTPHAVAALPGLPKDVVRGLQEALVHLSDTPLGRASLKPLAVDGWQVAKDADWDDIRQLNIHLLDRYLNK